MEDDHADGDATLPPPSPSPSPSSISPSSTRPLACPTSVACRGGGDRTRAPKWYCDEQADLLNYLNEHAPPDADKVAELLLSERATALRARPDRIVVAIDAPRSRYDRRCAVAVTYDNGYKNVLVAVDAFNTYEHDARDSRVAGLMRRVRDVPGLQKAPMYVAFVYDGDIDMSSMRSAIIAKIPDAKFESIDVATGDVVSRGRGGARNVHEHFKTSFSHDMLRLDDVIVKADEARYTREPPMTTLAREMMGGGRRDNRYADYVESARAHEGTPGSFRALQYCVYAADEIRAREERRCACGHVKY